MNDPILAIFWTKYLLWWVFRLRKMLLASEWISFYQGPLFLNVCLYSRVPPPSRLYLVNYLQNDPDKSAPYWPDRYDHCSAPNMITLIAPRSSVYVSVGLK